MISSGGVRSDQNIDSDQAEGIISDRPPGPLSPPRTTVQSHSLLTGVAKNHQSTAITRRVPSRRISALEATGSVKSVSSARGISDAGTERSNVINRRDTVAKSTLDLRRGSSRGDIGSSATIEHGNEVSRRRKECEPEPESSCSSLDLVSSLR